MRGTAIGVVLGIAIGTFGPSAARADDPVTFPPPTAPARSATSTLACPPPRIINPNAPRSATSTTTTPRSSATAPRPPYGVPSAVRASPPSPASPPQPYSPTVTYTPMPRYIPPATATPTPSYSVYQPPPAPRAPVYVQPPAPTRATVAAVCPPAPCPPPPCTPTFGVSLEATYTLLNDLDQPFGVDTFRPDQIRWSELDYEGAFGGRGAMRIALNPTSRIEIRGAYLGDFDDSASRGGSFGFQPGPGGGTGVVTVGQLTMESEARLITGEANVWFEVLRSGSARLDLGGGFRGIWFDESARASTTIIGGAASTVDSDVTDQFYGGQAASALHLDLGTKVVFTVSGKAFLGNISRDAVVVDTNFASGGVKTNESDHDQFTWGFEAEAGFVFRVTPAVGFSLGYSLLVLDDVLRADGAMDFSHFDSQTVQARQLDGQIIAHSFFAGITIGL
jgi:hypothetical protein